MKELFFAITIFAIIGILIPITVNAETPSPLKQIKNGIDISEIKCNYGLVMVLKNFNESPACVTLSTAEELIQRGWALNSIFENSKTLVVLSAPSVNEPYYEDVFEQIIEYDILAVNEIYGKDDVILLVDSDTMSYFEGKVPEQTLIQADVADIWIRDFGTLTTSTQVKFDYKPQYLEVEDADWIDDSFEQWFESTGLSSKETDLILDGGNFVFNGKDKAITTVRVFTDNPGYTEFEIDSMLKELLELNEIAYLPEEEGDITGHSDGMVMWISENKLLVNEYDEPFRTLVLSTLDTLSNTEIVEIPYVQNSGLWNDWPSACGYYVNSLVTNHYIYVPMFGFEEDSRVLSMIQSHTDKDVIGIDASNVCFMGGSVRCLSWTIDEMNLEIIENVLSLPKKDSNL